MNLQAMTKEKLQFLLPVVFTVGPLVPGNENVPQSHYDDEAGQTPMDAAESLRKYAVLLAENAEASHGRDQNFLETKIKSIVEGEVRVLVSSMTIEEIFAGRELFKKKIHTNIQTELVSTPVPTN